MIENKSGELALAWLIPAAGAVDPSRKKPIRRFVGEQRTLDCYAHSTADDCFLCIATARHGCKIPEGDICAEAFDCWPRELVTSAVNLVAM